MNAMQEEVRQLWQTVADMGKTMKEMKENQSQSVKPSQEGHSEEVQSMGSEQLPLLRQFQKLVPPKFKGTRDPDAT